MNNKCNVTGCEKEANGTSVYCSNACRQKVYRLRQGENRGDRESLPPETFLAIEIKAINSRLDTMAAYLKEFEARVIEMSNKYYGLANFVYKATAELKKGSGDPEKSVIEYS